MHFLQFLLFNCGGGFKSTINNSNRIFVTRVVKTFYLVCISPHAWGQGGKNGMTCAALVPIYSHSGEGLE